MKTTSAFIIILALSNSIHAQSGRSHRALFIGNSYTQYNNLPSIVSEMATSTGDTIICNSSSPGGYTLNMHSIYPPTESLISEGNWDYVVLQEQSQLPSFPDDQVATMVYPYATLLDSTIQADNPCARTTYYMTWGRKNGDASNCATFPPVCTYEGMDSLLRLRYLAMADMNQDMVSPAGAVWRYIRANHPTIELYASDGSHPSYAGSYAAACAFYTVFLRKDPEAITFHGTISSTEANIIKSAARAVVYDSLEYWSVGALDPVASFTHTNVGPVYSFTSLSINADTTFWLFGDGSTSYELDPIHTYGTAGMYNVMLISSRCDMRDTATTTIEVLPTSIKDSHEVEIELYPNPASDYILFTNEYNEPLPYSIYNEQGNIVERKSLVIGINKILLAQYSKGIYFLRIDHKKVRPIGYKFVVK